MLTLMLAWVRNNYIWLIPVILVAAYAAPLIGVLLPNVEDGLGESYEPNKTLVFVYSHGTQFHKWGPFPSILYAPAYGACLAYWYARHEFHKPFGAIFTSLTRPFEQVGVMLLLARLIGLLTVLLGVGMYARSLGKASGSQMAGLLTAVLCVATAPDLIYASVQTKPDGIMMAMLALSMAAYAEIVCLGFTPKRGMWMAVAAALSVSCKEATAPAFLAMFGWVLISGWMERRSFLKDFLRMVGIAVIVYLVVNVIYAPHAWVQHIKYWVGGPGKDKDIWAPPHQTNLEYLMDGWNGFLFNLGPGGVLAVLLAAVSSVFHWSRKMLSAWIPLVFYIVFVIITAGNLPRYYMLPTTVLAALPVALQIAALRESGWKRAAEVLLAAALVFNLWAADMGWAQVRTVQAWMTEQYAVSHVGKQQTIHLANPWKVREGATRLAYLGYKVDDRPIGELMKHPENMPDWILVSREWEDWMAAFALRPARARFYDSTGYRYDEFHGFGSLGYSLVETVHPDIPVWLEPPYLPWPVYKSPAKFDLMVYRKNAQK